MIGERLKKSREAKQWSQGDLATRSGFQPSAISHFETDRRMPSVSNLIRLADVLDVSLDWLTSRPERYSNYGEMRAKIISEITDQLPTLADGAVAMDGMPVFAANKMVVSYAADGVATGLLKVTREAFVVCEGPMRLCGTLYPHQLYSTRQAAERESRMLERSKSP